MRSNKPDDWKYAEQQKKTALMIRFLPEELSRFFDYKDSINNKEPIGKFIDTLVREASKRG
jgi:hypothetical protein